MARDILKRSQDDALEYARHMNYRFMAVVAGEGQDIDVISVADQEQSSVSWQQLNRDDFSL